MQPGSVAGLLPGPQLRDAFGEALVQLCRDNQQVVVLDGDLSESTRAIQVRFEFPDRFFNLGIAESNLVSVAAGMAACGLIPFVTGFASFLLCNAFDQIRLSVSLSNANVKIVGSHGGLSAAMDGPTPMAIEDLALAGGLPNLVIVVPSDATTMRLAVQAAADRPGPVFVRSSRHAFPVVYHAPSPPGFELGRAIQLRDGDDVTIIACGLMVAMALDAAVVLESRGIHARVLDMHTIRPLDTAAIGQAAMRTGAMVVAEEHLLHGGLGATVARVVAERHPVPMRFVGLSDLHPCSGPPLALLERYGMTASDIVSAARAAVAAK